MSDVTPTPKRTVSRKVAERPLPGQTAEVLYEGPVTPQPEVDLVPIEQDFSAEMFRSGWMAALAEVELQWSQGHDTLSRFLATQKRDRA